MMKKPCRLIAMLLAAMLSSVVCVFANTSETVTDVASGDKHYQEAIGVLQYLGIFTGDENGDMKSEEAITRAEIASVILRQMNINTLSEYKDVFADVDSSHWAANTIQTAYNNGIIAGFEDGTFRPDEDVTYEQAVKMVMCAINYETFAVASGGYPKGYLKLAGDKDVLDHVEGGVGMPILRRNVVKMVYNSLTAEYPYVVGVGGEAVEYKTSKDVTILSETRDIYYTEGIITAAPGKSIDISMELDNNQIAIEDEVMKSEVVNPQKLVAEYVRLFYRISNGDDSDKTAVYGVVLDSKIKTLTLDAEVIESIVTGYEGGTPALKYKENSRSKKVDIVNQPVIIYNDQPFTIANFAKLSPVDSNGNPIGFDEFIQPYEGSVKLTDFDRDNDYDILFIESYETSVVKVATPLRLQLEYPISIGSLIKLDTAKDDELNVNVLSDGEPIELRDLKAGDVISVRMNANFSDKTYSGEKYITIETTFDYVDGVVEGISEEERGYIAMVDGSEYRIIDNNKVINDVKALMGIKGKFYFNIFGSIAYVDSNIMGGLVGNERYGWLMNVYENEEGEAVAKMFTQDGDIRELQLASDVDYWAPKATSSVQTSEQEIDEKIGNREEDNSYFLQCSAYNETEQVSIRLCKYRTNSDGEITRLYMAVDENTVDEDSGAVRFSTTDHKNSVTRSGLFASKYYINEGMPQFTVPLYFENLRETQNYGYRMVGTSEFSATTGEDPLGYHCFFADIQDGQPGVSLKLIKSTSEAQSIEEYSTADDNPVIVISSVIKAVNADDDEVYIIKGYRDGKKVEYTTAGNVLVAQATAKLRYDKELYDTTTIWTKNSNTPLTSVLNKGDICGIAGSTSNAGIILRLVDTKALAEYITGGGVAGTVPETQFMLDETFSPTRDRVVFGYVEAVRTSPIVQYDLKVTDIDDGTETDITPETTVGIADTGRGVHFVHISKDGNIMVEEDVSDAYEVEVGDYVFMRNFKNDASRELFVIRFD